MQFLTCFFFNDNLFHFYDVIVVTRGRFRDEPTSMIDLKRHFVKLHFYIFVLINNILFMICDNCIGKFLLLSIINFHKEFLPVCTFNVCGDILFFFLVT